MKRRICTAEELMSRGALTLPASTSILRAAEILDDENIHGAPVINAYGKAVGVVTRTDIVRYLHEGGPVEKVDGITLEGVEESIELEGFGTLEENEGLEEPITEIMSTDLVIAGPQTSAGKLAALMRAEGIGRILIAEGDELLGLVSASDLLVALERYEEMIA